MGKGGETIKSICAQSGAHCQVDKMAPEGSREKNIIIKGPPEAVEAAKRLIAEKIGGGGGGYDDRHGGGRGYDAPYGGGYDPPQHAYQPAPAQQPVAMNPSTGQPDYSAQWADYYRSLGMMKEAEMIESQARGNAAPPQPQAAPQPAMGAQPDYSAQWAEYYRSLGKIKEAEAIEQNMRAKGGSVPPAGYAPQPQPQYGAPQGYHPQQQYY